MVTARWASSLQDSVYLDGLQIRKTVFVEEQGFSLEIEIDEIEDQCEYLYRNLSRQKMGSDW